MVKLNALKFTLNGTTAHFKKPQVNSINLTYTHIHKVALLGILGNLIWLGGWRSKAKNEHPEFYSKLSGLEISIVPDKHIFYKGVKHYCNTTGFANKDGKNAGSSLMVREQFLINPSWDVYIKESGCSEFSLIKEYILEQKSFGTLYLGKTHHPANVENGKMICIDKVCGINRIDSLFDLNKIVVGNARKLFMEYLPVGLDENCNYTYKEMGVSDGTVIECEGEGEYYKCGDRILYFD